MRIKRYCRLFKTTLIYQGILMEKGTSTLYKLKYYLYGDGDIAPINQYYLFIFIQVLLPIRDVFCNVQAKYEGLAISSYLISQFFYNHQPLHQTIKRLE